MKIKQMQIKYHQIQKNGQHRKENRLQSMELPFKIPYIIYNLNMPERSPNV